jgi:hypothetical protein
MALSCATIRSYLAVRQTSPLKIDLLQARVGCISISDVKIPMKRISSFETST